MSLSVNRTQVQMCFVSHGYVIALAYFTYLLRKENEDFNWKWN